MKSIETNTCLNPYYTGIHLHFPFLDEEVSYPEVLILIILEYIYMAMGATAEEVAAVS